MDKRIKQVKPSQVDLWCGNCYKPNTASQLYFLTAHKSLQNNQKSNNNQHVSPNLKLNSSLKRSLKKQTKNVINVPYAKEKYHVDQEYYKVQNHKQIYVRKDNQYLSKPTVYYSPNKIFERVVPKTIFFIPEQREIRRSENFLNVHLEPRPIHIYRPSPPIIQRSPKKSDITYYSPIKINFTSHSIAQERPKIIPILSAQTPKIERNIKQKLQDYRQEEIKLNAHLKQRKINVKSRSKETPQNENASKEGPTIDYLHLSPKKQEIEMNAMNKADLFTSVINNDEPKNQNFRSMNIDNKIPENQFNTNFLHVAQSMKVQRKLLTKIDDGDECKSVRDSIQEEQDLKESIVLGRMQSFGNIGMETLNSQMKTIDPTAPSSSIKLVSNSAMNITSTLSVSSTFNHHLVSPYSPNKLNKKLNNLKMENSLIGRFHEKVQRKKPNFL